MTSSDENTVLTKNVDYNLVFSDNILPGRASVEAVGIGKYTGTVSAEFDITESITDFTVNVLPENIEYNGRPHDGDIIVNVTSGSRTLTQNVDHTVQINDSVQIGTHDVNIYGMGNYTGSTKGYFTVDKRDISNATVTLDNYKFIYDGTKKSPSVSVTYSDGTALINGTDYTYKYENNVNVGTASVVVTGFGNYEGTRKEEFTISPAPKINLEECDIIPEKTNYTYDGSAHKPAITVVHGTNTLQQGTDYTVVYNGENGSGDLTNSGSKLVTVTGIGGCEGVRTVAYEVIPHTVNQGVTVSAISERHRFLRNIQKPLFMR